MTPEAQRLARVRARLSGFGSHVAEVGMRVGYDRGTHMPAAIGVIVGFDEYSVDVKWTGNSVEWLPSGTVTQEVWRFSGKHLYPI